MAESLPTAGTESVAPDSDTPVVLPTEPTSMEVASEQPTGTTRTFRAYDHGFTNGLLRIEADAFEVFVEESERLDFLQQQLHDVTTEIQELRQQQVTVKQQRQSLMEARLQAEAQQETLRAQLTTADAQLAENATAREAVVAEKQLLNPHYSWPPAVLYLLAGLVFVVADVAVMHNIASNGLDLDDTESWVFSFGLACVAFLLKPAVDRILEKPYAEGQHHGRNHRILISFAALALLTLGVLGYFRGDATSIENRKTVLTAQRTTLNEKRDKAIDSEENTDQLDEQLRLVNAELSKAETERVDSISMRLGLILAAVMFAIAGAVCLGIAFPALNALHRSQFVLRNRLRRLTARSVPLVERLHTLQAELAQQIKQQEQLVFLYQELPDIPTLVHRLALLLEREADLLAQRFKCRALLQQSMFRDGKARGLVYELQGNLSYSVSDADRRITELNKSSNYSDPGSEEPGSSGSRHPGKRPYVVLRRLISQHYTRQRPNGHTEAIEIE